MKESLAEAAGAVEIAEEELEQIEQGNHRPSEEVLMLLINHFGTHDDEAVQLWELAGYDADDGRAGAEEEVHQKTIVMAIAIDPRVMYSDSVHVQGSKHGVVLNFMQPGGGPTSNLPVARVGMSREQVRKLAGLLQDTLDQLDKLDKPKQLPSSTKRRHNDDTKKSS